MAAGDAVTSASISVTAGATQVVQPGSGIEWTIFNVYAPASATIEIYRTDGTNAILIDSNTGSFLNQTIRCTNGSYLSVKNTGGSSIYIQYDGTITKSS